VFGRMFPANLRRCPDDWENEFNFNSTHFKRSRWLGGNRFIPEHNRRKHLRTERVIKVGAFMALALCAGFSCYTEMMRAESQSQPGCWLPRWGFREGLERENLIA